MVGERNGVQRFKARDRGLSGGDDVDPGLYGAERHPEVTGVNRARDEFEIALARAADEAKTPLFGICRGIQVMNVAYEGSLVQHQEGHRIDAEGTHDVDHRADIYSLGCTLYVLVTGRVPFKGTTALEVMTKHVSEPPIPPG